MLQDLGETGAIARNVVVRLVERHLVPVLMLSCTSQKVLDILLTASTLMLLGECAFSEHTSVLIRLLVLDRRHFILQRPNKPVNLVETFLQGLLLHEHSLHLDHN